ncbi:MAG TPA: Crp/Fnr family transcriptional regulator [Gemmatimonas sp.]|nr:Crp/Fnr family transcriptional regulator [Gemmatimonas sp.]
MLATAAATVFASLSEIARQRLITAGNLRDFAAGATLFRTGDPPPGLFIVLSGQVRVLRSRDGRQRVMHSEGPGGTLGEVPLFEGGTMPATAEAVTDVCCLVIAKDALLAIIRDDPSVALLFLQRLAGRVRGLVERLDSASTQSVVGRLASYVLAQAAISESASFTLGLTQEALAEELGTVREVVVRGLANLRRDGVIASVGKGRYTVRDAAALRRLAE